MTDGDLELLLLKQESLLKELLDFSQRQSAELDPVGLDWLLAQKDRCLEDLRKIDTLATDWREQHKRPLQTEEQKIAAKVRDLLEKILRSEQNFEKVVGREKNAVSLQMAQLSNQMQYVQGTSNKGQRTRKVQGTRSLIT